MASRKDMRRADLAIPYIEPEKEGKEQDMSSTISTTMPMMAMFTRNKMLGWVAFVFALQAWLSETPESRKTASTPGYLGVGLALLSLVTGYSQYVLPPNMQPQPRMSAPAATPAGQ